MNPRQLTIPMSNSAEYTQVSKRIKLYAVSVAKESSLSVREKGELFEEFAKWAHNLAERIYLAVEIDETMPSENNNQ